MNMNFPYHSPLAFLRDVLAVIGIAVATGLLLAVVADGSLEPEPVTDTGVAVAGPSGSGLSGSGR